MPSTPWTRSTRCSRRDPSRRHARALRDPHTSALLDLSTNYTTTPRASTPRAPVPAVAVTRDSQLTPTDEKRCSSSTQRRQRSTDRHADLGSAIRPPPTCAPGPRAVTSVCRQRAPLGHARFTGAGCGINGSRQGNNFAAATPPGLEPESARPMRVSHARDPPRPTSRSCLSPH
jgi:hypothetical protein